ncbi:hypothetical protein DUNSADRAFT_12657, partial [Dunaliella salina]
IPDIYDSAKYDANHNDHLNLDLRELYVVSRQLAIAVIPNEYGIDPQGKLRIGSRIATELLGKLLVDLDAMREESVNTVRQEEAEERQRIKESMANRAEKALLHSIVEQQTTSSPSKSPHYLGW